jgi:ABC-2 type transport system ATP-binding protein
MLCRLGGGELCGEQPSYSCINVARRSGFRRNFSSILLRVFLSNDQSRSCRRAPGPGKRTTNPGKQPVASAARPAQAFADVVAVDGLDLEVMRGECFGLLGPNGAGKTTTIEICEGLTAPDAGTVELLGLNWASNENELRQRIGIQLQETQFPEKLTVDETLRLFRSFFRRGIPVEESIRTAQLEEKRHARVGTLSGGQKQRLAMACALVGDPELLFLDEPTTGLDPQARRHLWDLVDGLKQAGRTIILTTHYMDEAERLCDRVAIMDHGRIIALGTPQQLIASVGGEHIVEFAITGHESGDGWSTQLC